MSWVLIGYNCENLNILNLNYCKKITDNGLIEISKNCKNLEILKFQHCYKITDQRLQTIV
jgi:hypothetical protein